MPHEPTGRNWGKNLRHSEPPSVTGSVAGDGAKLLDRQHGLDTCTAGVTPGRAAFEQQQLKDTHGATMTTLTITQTDTVSDVCQKLRDVLQAEALIDEYFSPSGMTDQPFWKLVERHRWIACYAVTGGSEGHYVHVDLVYGYDGDWTGKVLHLITGKTFLGLAHALKIANRCAELLRV